MYFTQDLKLGAFFESSFYSLKPFR
jgi:hypothetical protein